MTDDEKFMKEALKQAKKAYAIDEVPIGCVIVQNGKIIARGYNRRNIDKNTLAHAELSAIRKASKKPGDWRLEDCDLYVTLEPCQMCAGAMYWAQLPRLVFGASDPKRGYRSMGASLHPRTEVRSGVLENECRTLLDDFFKKLR